VRLTTAVSLTLLIPVLAVGGLGRADGPVAASAAPVASGPAYRAEVTRTEHGIPHVVANDFASLGFGSGYAAAGTSICTLADTLVTGRGERSRWYGAGSYNDQVAMSGSNLQIDALVRDLRNRRVVEKLLADPKNGPSDRALRMVRGYAAGVNRWLAEVGGSRGVTDPVCRGAGYLRTRSTALDLWYGVYLANLIASTGFFAKEIVDAAPPSPTDPGLPEVPAAADVDRAALLAALGRDPKSPFGSNATAVGSRETSTGRGMLLGNPHFPWRGRYRFTQQHLTIPGKYDVAGASLIGSPVVNIGWNKRVAWSHTVSTAYRFTPYEYRLAGPTTYLTTDGPQRLERREVTIPVRRGDGSVQRVEEDLYRTPQGYVIDAPAALMPWSPASVWALRDANGEQLRTIDTFLAMGSATGVRDLLARQDRWGGMPWVNTTAADRAGNVLYADHSVVPNVPDDLAETCMTPTGRVLQAVAGLPGLDGTRAADGCAWRTDPDSVRPGVFGPSSLPKTVRKDWVVNANDSYWLPNPHVRLEGYAGILGCEKCERSLRTRMVYRYVMDRLGRGRKVTPATLRGTEHANRVMGAEVMRANGDLDTVCRAAAGGPSCDVLAAWDGRSDTDSVGTHIFEAFVERLPAEGVWRTPFSAADPVHTPRDLNVVNPQVIQAMRDALAFLAARGIAPATRWGRLQVAGDRGASPVPIGGGSGAAGNANAVASRWPKANRDRLTPITYGSSHIQAISFLDDGKVSARTILTYSQSENPRSRWSLDQTRLFSRERWVGFPWTRAQIRAHQVSRRVVTGP
jgi:acyl-homoserine-lactone acylase